MDRLPDWFYSPLLRSGLFVVAVFIVALFGYRIIGGDDHGWIDALYMTAITLTTVGYGEVIDLSGRPGARLFTTAILLLGVGTFLYFVSQLTAVVVDVNPLIRMRRRRMEANIDKLDQHTIVCGAGNTGLHVVRELVETDRPFVLVERDAERVAEVARVIGARFPALVGDATDDDILERAGVRRAAQLISCISSDPDNLMVAVSARLLGPDLRIVCRCEDDRVARKMLVAGANSVVAPSAIGGLRLVSEAVRPTSVEFLDQMLLDKDARLRIESLIIEAGSALEGEDVEALRARRIHGLHLLALRNTHGEWTFDPADRVVLQAGTGLVFMGGPSVRRTMELLTAEDP